MKRPITFIVQNSILWDWHAIGITLQLRLKVCPKKVVIYCINSNTMDFPIHIMSYYRRRL